MCVLWMCWDVVMQRLSQVGAEFKSDMVEAKEAKERRGLPSLPLSLYNSSSSLHSPTSFSLHFFLFLFTLLARGVFMCACMQTRVFQQRSIDLLICVCVCVCFYCIHGVSGVVYLSFDVYVLCLIDTDIVCA